METCLVTGNTYPVRQRIEAEPITTSFRFEELHPEHLDHRGNWICRPD